MLSTLPATLRPGVPGGANAAYSGRTLGAASVGASQGELPEDQIEGEECEELSAAAEIPRREGAKGREVFWRAGEAQGERTAGEITAAAETAAPDTPPETPPKTPSCGGAAARGSRLHSGVWPGVWLGVGTGVGKGTGDERPMGEIFEELRREGQAIEGGSSGSVLCRSRVVLSTGGRSSRTSMVGGVKGAKPVLGSGFWEATSGSGDGPLEAAVISPVPKTRQELIIETVCALKEIRGALERKHA